MDVRQVGDCDFRLHAVGPELVRRTLLSQLLTWITPLGHCQRPSAAQALPSESSSNFRSGSRNSSAAL